MASPQKSAKPKSCLGELAKLLAVAMVAVAGGGCHVKKGPSTNRGATRESRSAGWAVLDRAAEGRGASEGGAGLRGGQGKLGGSDKLGPVKLLFNHKDLSGWQVYNGRRNAWTVEKGVLTCNGPGGGWLMTDREYEGDVALMLDYRILAPSTASGVALRAPLSGEPAIAGLEIEVRDDAGSPAAPDQQMGAISGLVPPKFRAAEPVGVWNNLAVLVKGHVVEVRLNGVVVNQAILIGTLLKDGVRSHPGSLRTGGRIGLQGEGRIEFRRIGLFPLQ